MEEHVLLYGHSFVRQLKRFTEVRKMVNYGFDREETVVHMVGGLSQRDKINLVHEARGRLSQTLGQLPPIHVAVICLGTNDLCQFFMTAPSKIAKEVVEIGQLFLDNGVRRVAFIPCFPRYAPKGFSTKSLMFSAAGVYTLKDCEDKFRVRRAAFNEELDRLVKLEQHMEVMEMKGLRVDLEEKLPGGLHFSDAANRTFLNTLKRESIYMCRKARGRQGRLRLPRGASNAYSRRHRFEARTYRR